MLAETDDFVAVATEEIALRRAFPVEYRVTEPPPGSVLFFQRPPADDRRRRGRRAGGGIMTSPGVIDGDRLARGGRGHHRLRRPAEPRDQPSGPGGDRGRARSRSACSDPAARHNLGVALPEGVELTIEGTPAISRRAERRRHGPRPRRAGWGAAESMRDGTVVIDGDAGNAVAASIRAGTVVVRGNASTRAGIAMKGGLLLVAAASGRWPGS